MKRLTGSLYLWRLCVCLVVAIIILTYSPYVLKADATQPWFLGMPRTLWLSLLSAFAIVGLTAIGAVIHPANDE